MGPGRAEDLAVPGAEHPQAQGRDQR